ncbi:hypothetical protein BH09SUM1_BH09SUM1_27350 [soil metagenome]
MDSFTAQIETLIEEGGLCDHREAIIENILFCYQLLPKRASSDADIPIGASKLAGDADLPPEVPWPTIWQEPGLFLAQINLSELPQDNHIRMNGAHATGLLLFFVASDYLQVEETKIIQIPVSRMQDLVRKSSPGPAEQAPAWHPCSVEWRIAPSFPDHIGGLDSEVNELIDELHDAAHHLPEAPFPASLHHMFGHADEIQDHPVSYLEEKLGGPAVYDTLPHYPAVLLQISSDDEPGFGFVDGGTFYWLISRKDLQSGRYDRAVGNLQFF